MRKRGSVWVTRAGLLFVLAAVSLGAVTQGGGKTRTGRGPATEAPMTKTQLPEGGYELGFWTGRDGRPVERLRITAEGDVRITGGSLTIGGDAIVSGPGKGVVLRATNGERCYRITVDNAGVLTTTLVPCP